MTMDKDTGATVSALSRIGESERVEAISLVREGRVFDLGTDLGGSEMPSAPTETFSPFRLTQYRTPVCLRDHSDPPPFDFSMEILQGSPHVGSHIDGLAHIQSRGRAFGDVAARDVYDDFGWRRNGIESTAPIISRGLLLDIPRLLDVERLADGEEVSQRQVEDALKVAGATIRSGDVVLVRTGKFKEYTKATSQQYFAEQPGVGADAAVWMYERGMAVLGTDTSGTEPHPVKDKTKTTHQAMLVERGVHLLEILNLEDLAAAQVYQFLFVCLPLRIVGGTGSWVRPVAVI